MIHPSPTKGTRGRRSRCPISIALELLGDAWSLLVVRDLMFKNRHTFKEFLDGGEGIASNILSDRLRRLSENGIVEARSDPSDGRRSTYHLTSKGIALAPVLVELVVWSASFESTDAPPAVVRAMRGDRNTFVSDLRRRWKESKSSAKQGR